MTEQNSLLHPPFQRRAPTASPIHDLVALRWSPRAFAPTELAVAEILQLFEAARWAPSASNEQPWAFLAARRCDSAAFTRLLDCLNPNNRQWAAHAALLVLAVTRHTLTGKDQPNRTASYDLGQAVALLTVQATALGIAVHQMVGFDAAAARDRCAVPATHDVVSVLAIGRPGDPAALPPALQQREAAPRVRHPAPSFVFDTTWAAAPAWEAQP